ncbi:cobalamin biosynthesis protein [Vibrio sp. WXL103]|uniref:cobalamin biosynthesis protein n=1 Tax=Vibrio sp. WXL103 TaxID=3450710 RepID=UPI003EC5515A
MKKIAIYAITKQGAKQGQRLKNSLPFAELFVAPIGLTDDMHATPLVRPLSSFIAPRFDQFDAHIFICATGIVMRTIAPLIKDKRTDPAVVCLDEQATFVVSMLSGHRGGANQITHRVAHIVKATPVVTTASDVSENVSADMLGARFGWQLDAACEDAVTKVSAAIVNDQSVIIAQQAGEKNWWQYEKRMPSNILCHHTLNGIDPADFDAALLITDQARPNLTQWQQKVVLWRPKSLVIGIGCDRNTPISTLLAGLEAFSGEFNLSIDSIKSMTSIDLKADEVGLQQLSKLKQWPFTTFTPSQLDNREGIQNPSEYVKKVTGSNSVAEAAALALSQTKQLLVPKWTFKKDGYNMTIACCRLEFAEPLVKHKRKNWWGERKHGRDERHGNAMHNTQPIKVNLHGSEVVEGYQCKPKHVDLDRPMLFHTHHVLLCEGTRCAKAGAKNLAHDLRGILKRLGLGEGDKRIKISRTMCAGACRNRATMVIYQRATPDEGRLTNHGIWLRGIDEFSESQWRALFKALATHQPLREVIEPRYFAPFEEAKA